MLEIKLEMGKPFEPVSLDAQLRAAIGENFLGLSTYGQGRPVSVFVAGMVEGLQEAIEEVATAHDAENVPVARVASLEEVIAELQARISKLEGKKKNP